MRWIEILQTDWEASDELRKTEDVGTLRPNKSPNVVIMNSNDYVGRRWTVLA